MVLSVKQTYSVFICSIVADSEWLRSNEAALNADKVAAIVKNNATKKRTIVFAVAKFMSQKDLTEKHIEFCQLPYAIHRIMGA